MKFAIIYSIRTNNFTDDSVIQKISELWGKASIRFINQATIKYGIYHEYESNYRGDYTLSVAIKDESETYIEIQNNVKYEIFNVDLTDDHGIINTWKKIWKREEEGTLIRA
ncbi:AraC family transcriptional regulator [Gottfriedia acidiceleris]|uniref:AraC family transcriptional regulator n=1 Tax=Gottfriedia acidiceleris TaxID=371036 RepID=UPI002FFE4BCD